MAVSVREVPLYEQWGEASQDSPASCVQLRARLVPDANPQGKSRLSGQDFIRAGTLKFAKSHLLANFG